MAKSADPDQHARFVETARQLGCDEDEAAFDEKLKAAVGPKSSNEPDQPQASEPKPSDDLPPLSDKQWRDFENSLPRNERDKEPKPS